MEMATKIADIQTKGRKISIQILTNNFGIKGVQPGQGEHYPAHIHAVDHSTKLNVPVEIKSEKVMTNNHHVKGKLTKEEKLEISWFLNYYGKDELVDLFDRAMKGEDPGPLFDTLRKRKDHEHRNKNQ